MKRARGRAVAVLAAGLTGCVAIPHPSALDAQHARERWPQASVESLEQGRALYTGHCAACHALYAPASHTPEQWAKALPEMAAKAKLSPDEVDLVLAFLATVGR